MQATDTTAKQFCFFPPPSLCFLSASRVRVKQEGHGFNQACTVAMEWQKHMSESQVSLCGVCVPVSVKSSLLLVTEGSVFCHLHHHTGTRPTATLPCTCTRASWCAHTLEALHLHPHCRSPSRQRLHNDFQPAPNSILPALSQYMLHLITPLHRPAPSRSQRSVIGLHCASLCAALTYYYLLISVV